MGIKSWRNLGALVVASATLMGCNNGAQKDTKVVSSNNTGTPMAQTNQTPPGGFSTNQPFPLAPKTPITQANGAGGSNQPVGPTSSNSAPFPGTMPATPNFPPLPPSPPGSSLNPTVPNTGGFAPQAGLQATQPSNSQFGATYNGGPIMPNSGNPGTVPPIPPYGGSPR